MKIGIIGYGLRASHLIEQMMQLYPDTELAAAAEPDPVKIKELVHTFPDIKVYTDHKEMLEHEKLDGVMIGTRCNLHTDLTCDVLPQRVPLFLEKPVSISMDQLMRLQKAAETYPHQVVVSFPLRFALVVQRVKELLDSGLIGKVEHIQAVNFVPYGSVYYQSWYRDEEQTGGLFLQKATHDFDYLNALIGEKPVQIAAMESKQIFTGSKPAGLTCSQCEEKFTCAESAVLKRQKGEDVYGEACCFAEDTGNHDSATVLLRYESGVHASYTQNFFIRKSAAKRGARLMGYKGTIDFDFYTSEIKVSMHHTGQTELYTIHTHDKPHFGGDAALIKNFVEMIQSGRSSRSSLEDGMLSAYMCLKARESAVSQQFADLSFTKIGV